MQKSYVHLKSYIIARLLGGVPQLPVSLWQALYAKHFVYLISFNL